MQAVHSSLPLLRRKPVTLSNHQAAFLRGHSPTFRDEMTAKFAIPSQTLLLGSKLPETSPIKRTQQAGEEPGEKLRPSQNLFPGAEVMKVVLIESYLSTWHFLPRETESLFLHRSASAGTPSIRAAATRKVQIESWASVTQWLSSYPETPLRHWEALAEGCKPIPRDEMIRAWRFEIHSHPKPPETQFKPSSCSSIDILDPWQQQLRDVRRHPTRLANRPSTSATFQF